MLRFASPILSLCWPLKTVLAPVFKDCVGTVLTTVLTPLLKTVLVPVACGAKPQHEHCVTVGTVSPSSGFFLRFVGIWARVLGLSTLLQYLDLRPETRDLRVHVCLQSSTVPRRCWSIQWSIWDRRQEQCIQKLARTANRQHPRYFSRVSSCVSSFTTELLAPS